MSDVDPVQGQNEEAQKPDHEQPMVYHEKQRLQLCLMHTLNALLQDNCFSKADLDRIADGLHGSSWFNPHRSSLGLGNYDVNVLIAALQAVGLTMRWFDSRRSPASLNLQRIFGFVFNMPCRASLWPPSWPWSDRRHWFAVRRIDGGQFYNLDSKLDRPVLIDDFLSFAQHLLDNGSQMMVILEPGKADCFMLQ